MSQACSCTWEAAKGNKAAIVTISEMHRTRMEFRQVPTNQDSAAPPLMTLFAPPRAHTHTSKCNSEGGQWGQEKGPNKLAKSAKYAEMC